MDERAIKNGVLIQAANGSVWQIMDERPTVTARLIGPVALDVQKPIRVEDIKRDWKLGGAAAIKARADELRQWKKIGQKAILSHGDLHAPGAPI